MKEAGLTGYGRLCSGEQPLNLPRFLTNVNRPDRFLCKRYGHPHFTFSTVFGFRVPRVIGSGFDWGVV